MSANAIPLSMRAVARTAPNWVPALRGRDLSICECSGETRSPGFPDPLPRDADAKRYFFFGAGADEAGLVGLEGGKEPSGVIRR